MTTGDCKCHEARVDDESREPQLLRQVKVGGEYRMQVDVNWTYQEFVLPDKRDAENQVFVDQFR